MQNFNYHSHTKRCGHAVGEDEEYVLEAIRNGYKKMGFSDHAPYKNGYSSTERMHDYELKQYIESVKHLQQKYKDQIDIYIGLEFEFMEEQAEEIREYRKMMDYMIIGQHGASLYEPDFYDCNSDEDVRRYTSLLVKACDEGLADIIAHPDLFMYGKEEWTKTCEQAAHDICACAQRNNIPIEVNLNGIKYGKQQLGKELRYTYPYRAFWEIAQQYPIKVVYGLDAHFPKKYADQECFDLINKEILYDLSLDFLDELNFEHKL